MHIGDIVHVAVAVADNRMAAVVARHAHQHGIARVEVREKPPLHGRRIGRKLALGRIVIGARVAEGLLQPIWNAEHEGAAAARRQGVVAHVDGNAGVRGELANRGRLLVGEGEIGDEHHVRPVVETRLRREGCIRRVAIVRVVVGRRVKEARARHAGTRLGREFVVAHDLRHRRRDATANGPFAVLQIGRKAVVAMFAAHIPLSPLRLDERRNADVAERRHVAEGLFHGTRVGVRRLQVRALGDKG